MKHVEREIRGKLRRDIKNKEVFNLEYQIQKLVRK